MTEFRRRRQPTLFVGSMTAFADLTESTGIEPVEINSSDLAKLVAEHSRCQLVFLDPGTQLPACDETPLFYAVHDVPLDRPVNRLIKRLYDLVVATVVVTTVFPPLCVWVFVMQLKQAPGPLFHVRERRGVRGRTFRMLKFRTMRVYPADAAAESKQASANDDRTFRFGRFLRRRSLDEIPQFVNVLVGDMSTVGPRPYMPHLDQSFGIQSHGYAMRSLVKPGITGLAQSLGYRGEILEAEMLDRRVYWDLFYITHWSIWLDVRITLRTVWQIVAPPPAAY